MLRGRVARPSSQRGDHVGPSPGCIGSNDSALATNAAPTSIRGCSNWPARSSACGAFEGSSASGSNGLIVLTSQAGDVAAYFADAPRGPLFPSVTPPEVEAAEDIIGRPLPSLLRRIYAEAGDGGFGSDGGLASLTDGRRAVADLIDWLCSVTRRERDCAAGLPGSWLYLASGGCTMQWHPLLLAVGNPVLLHDADGWVPSWGEAPMTACARRPRHCGNSCGLGPGAGLGSTRRPRPSGPIG